MMCSDRMHGNFYRMYVLLLVLCCSLHGIGHSRANRPIRSIRPRPCEEYIKSRADALLSHKFVYDGRVQHVDVSNLDNVSQIQDMAEYLRQSFALDKYSPDASDVLTRGMIDWSRQMAETTSQGGVCTVTPETTSQDKQVTLIMQVKKEDLNNNFEWISFLLQDNNAEFTIKDVIWDEGKFSALTDRAIIVYHTASCELKYMPLMNYLNRFDQLNFAYGVFHLHDERIDGCRSHYPMSRFVLRNIGHPTFWTLKYLKHHILELPIGYQNGIASGGNPRKPSERRYLWAWMGDSTKVNRKQAIAAFLGDVNTQLEVNAENFYVHTYGHWDDPRQLSRSEYANLLSDTVFAPSPIGSWWGPEGTINSGLGTMRTWEALENGAIPLLELWSEFHEQSDTLKSGGSSGKSENWDLDARHSYLGRYNEDLGVPMPFVHHNWSNVVEVISPLVQNPRKLQKLWEEVRVWYQQVKERARTAAQKFVSERLWQSRAFRSAQEFGFCTVFYAEKNIYVNLRCEPQNADHTGP